MVSRLILMLAAALAAACVSEHNARFSVKEMERPAFGLETQPVPEGRALLSILYKIETTNNPIAADLYFDDAKAVSIIARRPITLEMAPASFIMKVHSDLYSTANVNELPITMQTGRHHYVIYDSDELYLLEVEEDIFMDTAVAFPPGPPPRKRLHPLAEAALIPAVPIVVPAIVIYSIFTGQPVQ